jgi:stearoyl-CoA desaturase (delta-9 desaturase)
MLVKPRRRPGIADISDLSKNEAVKFQHRYYVPLIVLMAFVVPTVIPWLAWGDAKGGYVYAAVLRLCFVHHVIFSLVYPLFPTLTVNGSPHSV